MSDDEIISSSSSDSEDDYVPMVKGGKPKKAVKIVEDEEDDADSDISEGLDEDKNEESAEDDDDNDNDSNSEVEVLPEYFEFEEQKKLAKNMKNDSDSDDEDDEDEDNEDEDEYFRKFDENLKKNVISEYHPEMLQHNYDEIETLTKITYVDNLIDDPLHKTMPILTKYERARILGERAKQINSGAKPFVAVDETVIDGYLIALKELEEKKIPFIIRRPLPNGACEYWKLKDLEML